MNFLQAKKTLPSDQSRVIQQAKFTYSPLGKPLKRNKSD